MDIRTEFDIGDGVFFIDKDGNPHKGCVRTIEVFARDNKKGIIQDIEYSITKENEFLGERIPENRVFLTKGALAEYALRLTSNI